MSRRKQAKPRAVLKHGSDEEVQQQDVNFIEGTKEEITTDHDSDEEEEEEEEEEQSPTLNDGDEIDTIRNHQKIFKDNDDGDEDEIEKDEKDLEEDVELNKIGNNGKSSHNDDDGDEEEILESLPPSTEVFEVNDIPNEDDNSSDTFYSDLYSTHTSSSYSPSMSEGAITPNSLIHHHLHNVHHPTEGDDNHLRGNNHHHHHHQQQQQQQQNRRRRRTRRSGASGVNGSLNDVNDDDNDVDDDDDDLDSGDDERVATTTSHEATEDGIDDLSNSMLGDVGKIPPLKIRKIDKNGTAAANATGGSGIKSEKMTGDGIKTASDGSYQCQFCDKSFPRLGYLKKHEQSHAEHLPFKCEYCARLFKHKRSRDRHTKLHTGDRRYRCPHCEAAFSRSDHLKIHMKTHDNQKPFQCTVCNRGYNTAAALTSHMQNHKKQAALLGGAGHALNFSPRSTGSGSSNGSLHKRRYATVENSPNRSEYRKTPRGSYISCIYCTKSDFTTLEQLSAHIQSMHENVTAKDIHQSSIANHSVFQLSCEYCTMKFPNIPAMLQHMRVTHVDRLTSPNSYFEHFNRLAASGTFSPRLATNARYEEMKIKTEEPSPTQERQVELEKDEEQVGPTDLSQPKKRSQTPLTQASNSTTEKPGAFLCNQCNAGLPDFDTFRAHLKTHITQGVTNFVCHHCSLSLRDQVEYERHIISHFLISSSEYSCTTPCNKAYSKPDDLQKHLFESHVQTMFKCTLCSDLFDTKVAIQVHFACAHSNESKIFRCSACTESFRAEKDFTTHVRSRHSSAGSIQCMFCRAVCSSELEMHFHLAAHARQFRCPACPETFHVEFLLDRHMQTHHAQKDGATLPAPNTSNPLYHSQFNKAPNNNNNILDYHAFAANKGLFSLAGNKFYSPLQVDTNSLNASNKHSALMYGLGQRYFDTNKTLLDMYNYHQEKTNSNYFVSPSGFEKNRISKVQPDPKVAERTQQSGNGFSCGICERNDFRTETEVHSHRKIVHNLKTGVSLRCAYCSGNFKSRSELEHHMKTCHNSTGKHKCLICDEIFPSPAILAEHKLQHSKVGQSGKCSHCSAALNDVASFKSHLSEHNVEGQIPVQCICCRQTLNSDFEVGLHAKFHTKASNTPENLCALCLEAIPATSDARVCEKCCRKHNLTTKFNLRFESSRSYVENRCNLCKMILPHAQRLQEHLIEHTFVGCEERGYSCYICSAVFTVPAGLLNHMNEHGSNARPYDCNLCSEKYFFRAELDNHLIEHESRDKVDIIKNEIATANQQQQQQPPQQQQQQQHQHQESQQQQQTQQQLQQQQHQQRHKTPPSLLETQLIKDISSKEKTPINEEENRPEVKKEVTDDAKQEDEEEEYIEVEKIAEASTNEEEHENE